VREAISGDADERREAVASFAAMDDDEFEAWLDQQEAEATRRGIPSERLGDRKPDVSDDPHRECGRR
jgi:hypothetical protein